MNPTPQMSAVASAPHPVGRSADRYSAVTTLIATVVALSFLFGTGSVGALGTGHWASDSPDRQRRPWPGNGDALLRPRPLRPTSVSNDGWRDQRSVIFPFPAC
ncbi:hypothetical protein FMEAI12_1630011 [Parafrankia sp. Ea1.12]|nr:hypothetical protein FMEAI12_1630011 [Parafrankia sp. Ea1.12]